MKIHFKDNGQDFLIWDIDATGNIIYSEPFQSHIWSKYRVVNHQLLMVGGTVTIEPRVPATYDDQMEIIYPIEKLEHS